MANFSGAVRIGDLNDFIAPSQACVVNIDGSKKTDALSVVAPNVPGFRQTTTDNETNAIKVTLQDCLACSGCVTSAETVLLEHQSTEELLQKLADPSVTVVATVSPQSRASLAAAYGLGIHECSQKLTGFLRSIGVQYVFDSHSARSIALRETASDFIRRLRAASTGPAPLRAVPSAAQPAFASAQPACCRSTGTAPERVGGGASCEGEGPQVDAAFCGVGRSDGLAAAASAGGNVAGGRVERGSDSATLPMLASSCPGWVCYAEKTHGDHILPHISTAKSPQAVAGTLVKRVFCRSKALDPARVYHVAIMPCFDKKLEAARADFELPHGGGGAVDNVVARGLGGADAAPDAGAAGPAAVPETDSVLTTSEVYGLLEERGVALAGVAGADMDCFVEGGDAGRDKLWGVKGGSGGYLEYVVRRAALEVYGKDLGGGDLQLRRVRNADLQEVFVEVDGRRVIGGALAYGFRNIQTLIRNIKTRRCKYDFVEVMACPSGCLNGGGQIKVDGGQAAVQRHIEQLDALYHSRGDVHLQWPEDDPNMPAIYRAAGADGPGAPVFQTEYHKREKTVQASVLDW